MVKAKNTKVKISSAMGTRSSLLMIQPPQFKCGGSVYLTLPADLLLGSVSRVNTLILYTEMPAGERGAGTPDLNQGFPAIQGCIAISQIRKYLRDEEKHHNNLMATFFAFRL